MLVQCPFHLIQHLHLPYTIFFYMDFNTLKYGVSGGLAGITVDLIYYPLETIKTRIMGSTVKQDLLKNAQQVSKFRGFSCQMIVSFPYSFSFFFIYENIRSHLPASHLTNILAASLSEAFANILRNPLQLVKQQLMVGRETSIKQSLSKIYKAKGMTGFYAGYSPTIMRDIIFSTIQMPLYEHIKVEYSKLLNTNKQAPIVCSLSGSTAACIAAFLTCPLDVIKTRHMTKIISKEKTQPLLALVRQIYLQYGIAGFFKGVKTRCFILTFGGIVYFYAFGTYKTLLTVKERS